MYPFNIYIIIIKGGIKMIYKGKEYDDNQILEILNNRDNDILTYKEKLDSVQAKISAYEISTKKKSICLGIDNGDMPAAYKYMGAD